MLILSGAKYKGRETKMSWASSLFLVVAEILHAVWLTALILKGVEQSFLQLHYCMLLAIAICDIRWLQGT